MVSNYRNNGNKYSNVWWNIKELYKVGNWEFKKDYKIKISKNTHSIGFETKTIELLDLKDLEQIQSEKYKILHIGAI